MDKEEPHENIIMIRGFPVSFPKVSKRYRYHGRVEKHNGYQASLDACGAVKGSKATRPSSHRVGATS